MASGTRSSLKRRGCEPEVLPYMQDRNSTPGRAKKRARFDGIETAPRPLTSSTHAQGVKGHVFQESLEGTSQLPLPTSSVNHESDEIPPSSKGCIKSNAPLDDCNLTNDTMDLSNGRTTLVEEPQAQVTGQAEQPTFPGPSSLVRVGSDATPYQSPTDTITVRIGLLEDDGRMTAVTTSGIPRESSDRRWAISPPGKQFFKAVLHYVESMEPYLERRYGRAVVSTSKVPHVPSKDVIFSEQTGYLILGRLDDILRPKRLRQDPPIDPADIELEETKQFWLRHPNLDRTDLYVFYILLPREDDLPTVWREVSVPAKYGHPISSLFPAGSFPTASTSNAGRNEAPSATSFQWRGLSTSATRLTSLKGAQTGSCPALPPSMDLTGSDASTLTVHPSPPHPIRTAFAYDPGQMCNPAIQIRDADGMDLNSDATSDSKSFTGSTRLFSPSFGDSEHLPPIPTLLAFRYISGQFLEDFQLLQKTVKSTAPARKKVLRTEAFFKIAEGLGMTRLGNDGGDLPVPLIVDDVSYRITPNLLRNCFPKLPAYRTLVNQKIRIKSWRKRYRFYLPYFQSHGHILMSRTPTHTTAKYREMQETLTTIARLACIFGSLEDLQVRVPADVTGGCRSQVLPPMVVRPLKNDALEIRVEELHASVESHLPLPKRRIGQSNPGQTDESS